MLKRYAAALTLGPFLHIRSNPLRAILLALLVLLLTVVTQVGGVILWLCLPVLASVHQFITGSQGYRLLIASSLFALIYIAVSLLAVPPLAAAFGRVPLACGIGSQGTYGPLTVWTCMLNRHYATRDAADTLESVSAALSLSQPDARVSYLDAGFPFFDWFPMLPHLSHRGGRKVDLALLYRDPGTGEPAPGRAPSPIGYWGYAPPGPGALQPCTGGESWLRWDLDWLQPMLAGLVLDEDGTATLLRGLASSPAVSRILLEPHLKARLVPGEAKIRFQGCAAARHDDHIHVEFR